MFYVVLEVQEDVGGARGVIPVVYDDYNAALAKLYTILAAAAASALPYHAGFILRSDGIMTDGRVFDRRGQEGDGNDA